MCTYCGCQSITTIGRLMAEHVEVINAAGDLRRACEAGDADEVRRTAALVAAGFDPHSEAEEVGLFSVMKEYDEFTDHIEGLCSEHVTLHDLLDRIVAGEYHLIAAYEHELREHIHKEDNGLFPAAAIALNGDDWERVVDQEAPVVEAAASGEAGAKASAHVCEHAHDGDHHHPHDHGHGHSHG